MKGNLTRKYIRLASAGLFALLLVGSLGLTPALAQPPGLPHQFYGNVTINGAPAAQGTTVEAYVDGVLNNSTTVDSQGRYGYDPVFTVTGSDGQTVSFKVGGTDASQTATYQAGGFTKLDLHITTTELSVTTSAATNITSSSATLNGNLNHMGGCTSVDVYFEYGTDTSYGSTTSTQSLTATGAFSADISGLTASTIYHYRAVATCGSTTVYGLDSTFTTSPPGLSVTTNAATSITASGATLNGTLNDLGTNPSVNVYFEYGTTPAYGSSTIPQSMSTTGAFSASISGLMANTTYHFRAVAQGTTTVYGADMTFTTPTGALSVSTGSATSVSATSATLNGTLTSLGDASVVNVYFEWGTDTNYGNSTAMQSRSSPGAFSAGISGLSPSTTYHFRAVAVGSTVYGSDATFTTLPANGSTTPPHQFYGTVYVGGAVAGAGVSVDAYVGGSPAASTTTDASGRYGYTSLFLVPGSSGSTVTFYVGGSLVPQTATWSSGGMTRLNLYSAVPSGLTITTSSLPNGTVGVAYSATLQASGGTTPYTWSIISGSLPDGLSLDASSGVISGTPTTAGTSSFTVQVTDSDSPPNTATKPLSITIGTEPPPDGQKLLGVDDAPNAQYGSAANSFQGNRFQAEASGTITKFKVKCRYSGNIKVAIYADDNGEPGALLNAVNTSTPVTVGWNTITFPATSVTQGSYYWLMFIGDTNGLVPNHSLSGGTFRHRPENYDTFTFPDPAGSMSPGTYDRIRFLAGWE